MSFFPIGSDGDPASLKKRSDSISRQTGCAGGESGDKRRGGHHQSRASQPEHRGHPFGDDSAAEKIRIRRSAEPQKAGRDKTGSESRPT